MASPEETFAAIAAALGGGADISEGTGFGRNPGLRVNGRIFAMLNGEELVVKLPAERCARLVAGGAAVPFDAGKGRPMREWVKFPHRDAEDWRGAAEEALGFVRQSSRPA